MKKNLSLVALLLMIASLCFAGTRKGAIPKNMGNSVIVMSDTVYETTKTVNDLFGNPKETTNVVITNSESELKISTEEVKDGRITIKFDVTFKFSGSGTCYPAKLYYEVPLTFQSGTISCNGGPYNDPHGFGQVLMWLSQLVPRSYN